MLLIDYESRALRRSISTPTRCGINEKVLALIPSMVLLGTKGEKIKGSTKRRKRTGRAATTKDDVALGPATFKGEHRGPRLSGHVRPTIQLSRDIWTARRVSGFVFFEAFNDTLHGPPELHESVDPHARGYNLLPV